VGVQIYISAQVGPEIYLGGGWMTWGLSAPGCLDRAPSIPGARVYHRQTVSTAWPRPGIMGKESTANPPVDAGGGGWAAAWPPGTPQAPPQQGPEAPPGTPGRGARPPGGPVWHVTKSLFFSLSPLKTGPSQRTDHPHS
jgi:hypothetical protein